MDLNIPGCFRKGSNSTGHVCVLTSIVATPVVASSKHSGICGREAYWSPEELLPLLVAGFC